LKIHLLLRLTEIEVMRGMVVEGKMGKKMWLSHELWWQLFVVKGKMVILVQRLCFGLGWDWMRPEQEVDLVTDKPSLV
jgi:hypothetical protein